jgi:hypothetical protein
MNGSPTTPPTTPRNKRKNPNNGLTDVDLIHTKDDLEAINKIMKSEYESPGNIVNPNQNGNEGLFQHLNKKQKLENELINPPSDPSDPYDVDSDSEDDDSSRIGGKSRTRRRRVRRRKTNKKKTRKAKKKTNKKKRKGNKKRKTRARTRRKH